MLIDVSHHNGVLNWNKLKDYIDGAIIRMGYGNDVLTQDDKYFITNVNGCIANNIPFGLYFYSYAKNFEMLNSELDHIKRLIGAYKDNLTYPVFLDLEEWDTTSFSNQAAKGFITCMQELCVPYGIYASESWFENYLDITQLRSDGAKLWVAKWGGELNNKDIWDYWQFTSNGEVAGYRPLDMSTIISDDTIIKAGDFIAVNPDEIDKETGNEYVYDTNYRKNRIWFSKYRVREVGNETVLLEKDGSVFTRLDINKVRKLL